MISVKTFYGERISYRSRHWLRITSYWQPRCHSAIHSSIEQTQKRNQAVRLLHSSPSKIVQEAAVMTKDDRKVALVTGGSGGIGRVVSLRLAKDGFSVVLHYAGNAEKAEQVANEIKAADGQTVVIQADVSNETDVERMFKQIIDTFGRIDVVVHTAGIMPVMTIAETDLTVFDRIISTNLRGTLIVFKHAAKNVAEGGRIMAFSSSVIAKSFPTYGPYIASKAGVEGLVHVLTNELRGRNITVNAVAPGPIPTELFLKGKSEARIDEFKEMSPLERLGQPEDIAGVVSFLAGPDGGWVNGQVVRVNGGFA